MTMAPTLKGVIEQVRQELEEMNSETPESSSDVRDAKRLLEWLQELDALKSDEVAALDNAAQALQRLAGGIRQSSDMPDSEKHYKNRLSKLLNNVEEVVQLERKRRQQKHDDNKRRTP